jgi:nucleotide-binding universal stress UspA family protein
MTIEHIKSVFAPVFATDEEGGVDAGARSAAAAYAASLADATGAHLSLRVLGMKVVPPYSFAPAFVGSLTGPVNARIEAGLAAARTTLQKRLSVAGSPVDVQTDFLTHEAILQAVSFHGRLHDLAVVDQPVEYYSASRAAVEELLFHTGRPLIVVPNNRGTFAAGRIIIAWDGSAAAARALNDAMPLLRGAEYVSLVSIVNEKDLSKMAPGAEIAPHLARHGVKAEVADIPLSGSAGRTLLDRAELVRADMLVMGAFVHARWRQFIVGGVTETMLTEAAIPIFMSH